MTGKRAFWLLPLVLLGTSLQSRAQNTVQVVWQNTPATVLCDPSGKPLPAGSAAAGDGSVIQLGYYSNATESAPFEGRFVPVTGEESLNRAFLKTSIGDPGRGPDGRFSLSSVFQLDSPATGVSLPPAGTPLAIRFFNGKTIASSTHFNAVTGGSNWRWQAPASAPGEVVALSLADPNLLWKGGTDSKLRTTLKCGVVFGTPIADQSVSSNSPASFRVNASGLEPLFYQWRKGGVNIPGANASSYTILSTGTSDAGVYDVIVSNPKGSFRSNPAALKVDQTRGSFLVEQPDSLSAIKNTRVSQTILVQPAASDVTSTQYQVYSVKNAVRTPVSGLAGTVPLSGELPLNVRSISAAGDYVVHLKRTFSDGTTAETDSESFHIDFKSWDDAAGIYEALLEDVNNLPNDNARFRGAVSIAVSRIGTISGRLTYLEALPLSPDLQNIRIYTPVTRRFTGTFSPVPGEDLNFTCVPILATGTQAHRQDLLLELDVSTSPPSLKATVRDHASAGGDLTTDGILSQSAPSPRSFTKLPATATGLAGFYNVASPASNSLLQFQILPSGQAAWLSRSNGSAGSGSALLHANSDTQFAASLAETASTASTSLLVTRGLLGTLFLSKTAADTWTATIGALSEPGSLEKQSTTLARLRGVNTYDSQKFASRENWSGVEALAFPNSHPRIWGGALASTAPDFLKSGLPLLLKVHDPLTGGTETTQQWKLTLSSAGAVKATSLQTGATLAPPLTLRLDKTRGGFTGLYMLPNDRSRRSLYGIALTPEPGSTLRGQGWTEAGAAPGVRSGAWTLELQN